MRAMFQRCQPQNTPIFVEFLKSRGFTPEDVAPFNLGVYRYRPSDWQAYGLVKAFDNGIFLPLSDELGNPVGFELRSTKQKAHTKYYDPVGRYYFFGFTKNCIQEIFDTETVFLTEGTFKTIAFSLWKPNVLGLMNNRISDSQKVFLKRYAKKVYLCFDFDKWGGIFQKKMAAQLREEGFDVEIFRYIHATDSTKDVEVKDADDLMRVNGKDKFLRLMNRRFKEINNGLN